MRSLVDDLIIFNIVLSGFYKYSYTIYGWMNLCFNMVQINEQSSSTNLTISYLDLGSLNFAVFNNYNFIAI